MSQLDLNFDARKHASEAPSEVVDKIKKLLRMKQGGTEGEIDNALRMARQLADRHNIDLTTVNTAQESPLATLGHRAIRISKSSDDDYCAGQIVQAFFHVDIVRSRKFDENWQEIWEMVMIGTAVDIDIAEYVFHFLTSHFKAAWRRRNKRLKKRTLFIHGMMHGIMSKLKDVNELTIKVGSPQETLVLSRKAYIEQLFPKLKIVDSKGPKLDGAAAAAGFGAGRQTNIRQPLAGAPVAPKPLQLK